MVSSRSGKGQHSLEVYTNAIEAGESGSFSPKIFQTNLPTIVHNQNYIRTNILLRNPLNKCQHVYRVGQSTGMPQKQKKYVALCAKIPYVIESKMD